MPKVQPDISEGRKVLAQLAKLDRALSDAQDLASSLISDKSKFPGASTLANEIYLDLEAKRSKLRKMSERRERSGGIGPGPF